MIALISSALWASDPWNRPKELRIIPEPPQSWTELRLEEKRLRFWWEGEQADVSILTEKGWETLAQNISPGWISPPLPIPSLFRVRCANGLRWSAVTMAQAWTTPLEIEQLLHSDSDNWIPSNSTTEIDSTNDGSVWFGLLGGGVTQLKPNNKTSHLGRWEGLPSERVISLDAQNNDLLVGTSQGAVLLKGDENTQRYWGLELPDQYVQRVLLDNKNIWIGTYKGLFLEDDTGATFTPLKPWSVFSLSVVQEGLLVGYEGLTLIESDGSTSTVNWPGNTYDILSESDGTRWLATENRGVVKYKESQSEIYLDCNANQILNVQGLWVAAGTEGLIAPNKVIHRPAVFNSKAVWSLFKHKDAILVGTDRGAYAFDTRTQSIRTDLLPKTAQSIQSSDPDLHFQLQLPPNIETIAFFQKSDTWWVLSTDKIFSTEEIIHLPAPALSGVIWLDRFWINTEQGVFWYEEESQKWIPVQNIPLMAQLKTDGRTLWGLSANRIPYQIQPSRSYDRLTALDVAPSGKATCVATEDGLWRIWTGSEELAQRNNEDLEELISGVLIQAVLGDGKQGCWFVGEKVLGHVSEDLELTKIILGELPAVYNLKYAWNGGFWLDTEEGSYFIHPQAINPDRWP
ncbi:MAG: hypothetical protein CMK59_07040 [Proteobacteria bacterium]|nr:hypothetical protein [Pseudomonadota bacterium]